MPTATAITPNAGAAASTGPADQAVAAPISGPGPQAPLVESPTHPNPDAWYRANTATFTWTQPPDGPEIQSYDWFLGRSPDTIPEGVYRGMTTTKTWDALDDGTWYLHRTGHEQRPGMGRNGLPDDPRGRETATSEPGGGSAGPDRVRRLVCHAGQRSGERELFSGSGVAKVEVSSDGVAWQPYTAALVLSADTPATTIYARATDAAGNISEQISTTVKIDRTPPNSHVDGGAGPGAWIAEVVTNPAGNHELALAGAVADNLSGRAGIDLRYDGVDGTGSTTFGSWHPFPARPQIEVNWYYTPTLQIGAGYHILTGQAFDVAGNREAEYELGSVLWLPKASPDIAGSSLTASPKTLRPGEAATFTLVARNAGQQEAYVSVVDTLPEGLAPVLEALGDMSYDPATRAVTWPASLLWPGQSVQRTFQARRGCRPVRDEPDDARFVPCLLA